MAPVLVRTLLETKQTVPEFLQQYMPEGEELQNLQFPSEQDDDVGGVDAGAWGEGGGGGDAGDAWGGGGGETSAPGGDGGNAWGGAGETSAAASGGWETGGASTGGGGW